MNNQLKVLGETEVFERAPSVFTNTRNPNTTSTKYSHINTLEVLKIMKSAGWDVTDARQQRSTNEFTKHAVTLTPSGHVSDYNRTEVPQILLTNAHNGTSSYQLRVAMHVLVCSNGMVASKSYGTEQLIHIGLTTTHVLKAVERIQSKGDMLREQVEAFKSTLLTKDQRTLFAYRVANIRYGEFGRAPKGFNHLHLLNTRRREELVDSNSLWRTMNTVQENILRAGMPGVRGIRSINENIRINEELWALAEQYVYNKGVK